MIRPGGEDRWCAGIEAKRLLSEECLDEIDVERDTDVVACPQGLRGGGNGGVGLELKAVTAGFVDPANVQAVNELDVSQPFEFCRA